MRKLLKSQQGSTLAMVLIAFFVLSVLGTAIMSLGLMNFKAKVIDAKEKEAFYLAESGLDEARAITIKHVEDLIQDSNTYAEGKLTEFLKTKRDSDADRDNYFNADGTVKAEKQSELDTKLKEYFKDRFIVNFNPTVLKGKLEDPQRYSLVKKQTDDKPVITTDIDMSTSFSKKPSSTEETFLFKLTSTYMDDDRNKKIVSATYEIEIPYGLKYYVSDDLVKMKENVLWTKAIFAEKNLVVNKGDLEVNGDVYVFGEIPTSMAAKKNPRNYKGVVLDQLGTKIKINGNVATNSYIHSIVDGGVIEIGDPSVNKNYNVYAESISTNDGANGNKIYVRGFVHTNDDVKLNGKDNIIEFQGNFYGFGDGKDGYNQSSSIVINSSDIGSGSSISMTGNEDPPATYYYKETGNFIKGVTYIDTDSDTANATISSYQTGESVSIKENYFAYGHFIDYEGMPTEDQKYKGENVTFEERGPLILAKSYKEPTTDEFGNPIEKEVAIDNASNPDPDKKIEYFRAVNKDPNKPSFNFGGNGIKIFNIGHTRGLYYQNNTLKEPEGGAALADVEVMYRDIEREYKFNVNRMGDPQIGHPEENDYRYLTDELKDTVNTRLRIDQKFDFHDSDPENKYNSHTAEQATQEISSDKGKIYYVNSNDETVVFARAGETIPSSLSGATIITVNKDVFSGFIITKGDVHFIGPMTFKGLVVTNQSLYFGGSGTKKISFTPKDGVTGEMTTEYIDILQNIYQLKKDGKNLFVEFSGDNKETDYFAGTPTDVQSKSSIKGSNIGDFVKIKDWTIEDNRTK